VTQSQESPTGTQPSDPPPPKTAPMTPPISPERTANSAADGTANKTVQSRTARAVWATVGGVSLFLALLGVILPLLPTTPFVLLAAFAFAKSIPRVRTWLTGHRIFGPIIADWEAHHAIAPRYKVLSCGLMAAVFIGSLLAGASTTILIVQLVLMSASVTFILTRANGPRPPAGPAAKEKHPVLRLATSHTRFPW